MGHPRVYLNLTPNGRVECPYCSRLFVNPKIAGRVLPEIGVATPSAHEAGEERLRWVREQGLEIENDPREYDYRPGYYAGFFYDPDGIKLEIVHVP